MTRINSSRRTYACTQEASGFTVADGTRVLAAASGAPAALRTVHRDRRVCHSLKRLMEKRHGVDGS